MAVPAKYGNIYIPVKYFLSSYRALSDGRAGISHLDEHLKASEFLLSEWKVIWVGACAVLRTAITLFQVDQKSCINAEIRKCLALEWKYINKEREKNSIYWNFILKERDRIIHQYEWTAYEAWMNKDGIVKPAGRISLLSIKPGDVDNVLIMKSGPHKNRNCLDLLKESADWVEERIYNAIRHAGFEPEERRNVISFEKQPIQAPVDTILGKHIADN